MVVMSLDSYESLTDYIEAKLDEADLMAKNDSIRYTHEEVFSSLREKIKPKNSKYHIFPESQASFTLPRLLRTLCQRGFGNTYKQLRAGVEHLGSDGVSRQNAPVEHFERVSRTAVL